MKIKQTILTLLAIVFSVVFPHTGIINFPFLYTVPILVFIYLCLRYRGEKFIDVGVNFKSISFKSFLVGASIGILFFAFSQLILYPCMEWFFDFSEVEVGMYEQIRHNTGFYVFLLVMGWIIGGFYEEVVFHGFIFTSLEKMMSGKYATSISFIITSILFGFYHFQLGGADAFNAFIIGMGYLSLVLYFKRNIWYGVFCHAAYNSMAMTFLYLGYL